MTNRNSAQICVLWSNGHKDYAETWQELLDVVRLSQPRVVSEEKFRKQLGRRARIWSGYRIKTDLPPQQLFQELEWAKMVVIVSP